MNPFGAVFTITLLILIVAWPFIAIYIAKQYTTPSTRQGFTTYLTQNPHGRCSNPNHPSNCNTECENPNKCDHAPHSGEAP